MKQLVLGMVFSVLAGTALAQVGDIRQAWQTEQQRIDALEQAGDFRQARARLQVLFAQDSTTDRARKLAELSFRLREAEAALTYYQYCLDHGATDRLMVLRMAQSFGMTGDFRKAKSFFFAYQDSLEQAGVDFEPMNRELTEASFYLDSSSYTSYPVKVAAEHDAMAPAHWNGQLLYISNQASQPFNRPRDPSSGQDMFDYYTVEVEYEKVTREPQPVKGLNSPLHEGPATALSADTLIITRNHRRLNGRGQYPLQLYMAVQEGGKWRLSELPFVTPDHNYAFPAWDQQRSRLLFASDKPGGKGGFDIYCAWYEGGSWSEPLWLGPIINTEVNDIYPAAGVDGSLMFASEGLLGLGGLDIYQALQDTVGMPTYVQNLGYPVNSPADDFAFAMATDTVSGYITTNRYTPGRDELMFYEIHPIVLRGVVRDASNNEGLPGATVVIREINSPDREVLTDDEGVYYTKIYPGKLYYIDATHPDHKPDLLFLSTEDNPDYAPMEAEQILERRIKLFVIGNVRDAYTFSKVNAPRLEVINKTTGVTSYYEADTLGQFDLELDAENNYLFIAEKDGKTGFQEFKVPELGEASYTYYVNIFMEDYRMYELSGVVREASSGQPIPYAQLELVNQNTGQRRLLFADSEGAYRLLANSFYSYYLYTQSGLKGCLQYIPPYEIEPERKLDVALY